MGAGGGIRASFGQCTDGTDFFLKIASLRLLPKTLKRLIKGPRPGHLTCVPRTQTNMTPITNYIPIKLVLSPQTCAGK